MRFNYIKLIEKNDLLSLLKESLYLYKYNRIEKTDIIAYIDLFNKYNNDNIKIDTIEKNNITIIKGNNFLNIYIGAENEE